MLGNFDYKAFIDLFIGVVLIWNWFSYIDLMNSNTRFLILNAFIFFTNFKYRYIDFKCAFKLEFLKGIFKYSYGLLAFLQLLYIFLILLMTMYITLQLFTIMACYLSFHNHFIIKIDLFSSLFIILYSFIFF